MEALVPHWVTQHSFTILVVWWLFSNAASALPTPLEGERWYKFFFALAHSIAGNSGRIMATVFPRIPVEVKGDSQATNGGSAVGTGAGK
jgi:hypothetical protein